MTKVRMELAHEYDERPFFIADTEELILFTKVWPALETSWGWEVGKRNMPLPFDELLSNVDGECTNFTEVIQTGSALAGEPLDHWSADLLIDGEVRMYVRLIPHPEAWQ